MKELKFSISDTPTDIIDVLRPFNKKRSADKQVLLQKVPWEHAKQELTAMALYSQGVDVSQVGGPFVDDLIAMRALRPFSNREIDSMGGPSAFSKVAWENAHRASEGHIFAVPWIVDPRAIFYWRDPLEKAGIDGSEAFKTFEQMEETFRRLQANGIKTPLSLPLENGLANLQTACTWIWGAGGDIANDKEVLVLHPQSLKGLRDYFNLSQYMFSNEQTVSKSVTHLDSFLKQKTVVTVGNLPIYHYLPPKIRSQIGVALAPGPFFVGGSNLVVWQSSREEDDAVNLVHYLTGEEAQKEYCARIGFLPARMSVLNEPPFSTDPELQVFVRSANSGRSWANIRMGGLLEELLTNAIQSIWAKVLANPDTDSEAAIIDELEPIVSRINRWYG